MAAIYFDDSLGALVSAIRDVMGEDALERGVILRDAIGLLTFISPLNWTSDESRAKCEKHLRDAVGAYGREDHILLFADDPGAKQLLEDKERLYVQVGDHFCNLVDRRIVGSGWLNDPADFIASPPRVVFASLKGGVGRSTAIAVVASDFAARGRNVLAIDLDLEAPGLGELLLDNERKPKYGVIDYLVENGIGGISDSDMDQFIGTSALTTSSGGRVDVVPALGARSAEEPQNVLPKLARAMIEDITPDGEVKSVGVQVSEMIDRLTKKNSYDVVVIDSRAGLAELAAPAVLGLGAIVLLFGTAQEQTIAGYRALFSALKQLAMRNLENGSKADWRMFFKPVYAKASLDPKIGERFSADLYELFAEHLYDQETSAETSELSINFSMDDQNAPHSPLVIKFDPNFVDFDPARNESQLAHAFYEQAFRPFLDKLDELLRDLAEVRQTQEQKA